MLEILVALKLITAACKKDELCKYKVTHCALYGKKKDSDQINKDINRCLHKLKGRLRD